MDMEANACGGSSQTMQLGFDLGGCICQKHYVIGVVGVGNCFCEVPSASFLCQLETVLPTANYLYLIETHEVI